MATFADRLREVMEARRPPITQQRLAELAGVSQSAVTNWLRMRAGERPYEDNVSKLCQVFGVRRDWLLHGEEPRTAPKATARIRETDPGYNDAEKVVFIMKVGSSKLKRQVREFLDLAQKEARSGTPPEKADQS